MQCRRGTSAQPPSLGRLRAQPVPTSPASWRSAAGKENARGRRTPRALETFEDMLQPRPRLAPPGPVALPIARTILHLGNATRADGRRAGRRSWSAARGAGRHGVRAEGSNRRLIVPGGLRDRSCRTSRGGPGQRRNGCTIVLGQRTARRDRRPLLLGHGAWPPPEWPLHGQIQPDRWRARPHLSAGSRTSKVDPDPSAVGAAGVAPVGTRALAAPARGGAGKCRICR